jgi:hypothetical protein
MWNTAWNQQAARAGRSLSEQVLSNGGVRMACRWEDESEELMTELEQFLWPWFTRVAAGTPPHWRLTLKPARAFPEAWRRACTAPLQIRQSPVPLFNLAALSGRSGSGALLAWDPHMQVGYQVDQDRGELDFFGDADSAFVHLIELVGHYALLIEQSRETLVLKAAALHRIGTQEVLAIGGAHEESKTNTLLSHIASGDCGYFSGSRLLLNVEDGHAAVRGWPDYPQLSVGTLRAHPFLARRLGLRLSDARGRALPADHQLLVPPEDFLQAIGQPRLTRGRLAGLLLPRTQPRALSSCSSAGAREKGAVDPAELFEWPQRSITARWHGLPFAQNPHAEQVSDAAWAVLRELPWLRPSSPGLAAAAMELL